MQGVLGVVGPLGHAVAGVAQAVLGLAGRAVRGGPGVVDHPVGAIAQRGLVAVLLRGAHDVLLRVDEAVLDAVGLPGHGLRGAHLLGEGVHVLAELAARALDVGADLVGVVARGHRVSFAGFRVSGIS